MFGAAVKTAEARGKRVGAWKPPEDRDTKVPGGVGGSKAAAADDCSESRWLVSQVPRGRDGSHRLRSEGEGKKKKAVVPVHLTCEAAR